MKDVECAEQSGKNNTKITSSLFFELWEKIHQKIGVILREKKTTITPKIKIAKIGNLIFISTQQIPDLSCKFQNFTKKNNLKFCKRQTKKLQVPTFFFKFYKKKPDIIISN